MYNTAVIPLMWCCLSKTMTPSIRSNGLKKTMLIFRIGQVKAQTSTRVWTTKELFTHNLSSEKLQCTDVHRLIQPHRLNAVEGAAATGRVLVLVTIYIHISALHFRLTCFYIEDVKTFMFSNCPFSVMIIQRENFHAGWRYFADTVDSFLAGCLLFSEWKKERQR